MVTGEVMKRVSAVLVGVMALCAGVRAQDVFDSSSGQPDRLNLQPSKRFFARVGYTYIKPNTKSGETTDLSGPVIRYGEISSRTDYSNPSTALLVGQLDRAMEYDNVGGLGIPGGVKSEAKGAGSPTVELGMFLDDEQKWAVQGFVLALPFDNSIEGRGQVNHVSMDTGEVTLSRANYLDGKTVVKTKQLPPTFILNRYFGSRGAKLRPSIGLGVTYAIFFDTQATDVLNEYSGGRTEVKIKNAFGAGPFVGLQYQLTDNIHLSGSLGYVKLKTEAKLTTRDTMFTSASPVLYDYSGAIGRTNQGFTEMPAAPPFFAGGAALVDDMLTTIARARGGNLGTYVRRLKTELDPWVFNVSVGYSF